jgi:GntR family transcriptional regulator, transcriptional repressor for pyruvate dehydrogenase complex
VTTPNRSMSPPNQHRPQKTATLLAQRIVREITERELGPGLMLPPERDMLEEYGVARGTLREALRFLEMQGVLTIKPGPGGGPVVNAPDARPLASVVALLLQRSDAPFRTILEAREVLEPAMASMAAERGDEQDVAAIATSIADMKAHLGDLRLFLEDNHIFHAAIGRASGNQLFDYLLASLSWITDGTILGVDYPEKRRTAILDAHERIYERIAAQDAEGAADAMRRHIQEFAQYLDRYYKHVVDRPIRWDRVMQ